QFLRLPAAMRKRRGWTNEDEGVSSQAHFREAGSHQLTNVLLRHAFVQGSEHRAEDIARGLAGKAHQLELVGRFDGAARNGDGISGDAVECRRGGAEVVVKRERESFFNADPTGLDVAVSEGRSNQLGGAFILLPNTDFCRIAKRLAHACLFKGRRNDDGIASPRNDESEEPFAGPPTDTGE